MKAEFPLPESHMTLYLMSDGHLVYWLYSLKQQDSITHPITGEKSKHHSLYLQILKFEVSHCTVYLYMQITLYILCV